VSSWSEFTLVLIAHFTLVLIAHFMVYDCVIVREARDGNGEKGGQWE
jgi:hypothetical protein